MSPDTNKVDHFLHTWSGLQENAGVAQALRALQELEEKMAPAREIAERVVSEISAKYRSDLEKTAATVDRIWKDQQRFQDTINEQSRLLGRLADQFAPLQEAFRQLPGRTRRAVTALFHHGWYPDMDMEPREMLQLAASLERGSLGSVEMELARWYSHTLKVMPDSIGQRFPERKRFVGLATAAHQRGEYALAIPLVLTQVDGLCFQCTGGHYFRQVDQRPSTAGFADAGAKVGTLISSLLEPLGGVNWLNATSTQRRQLTMPEGVLNRHLVMHGESLDFDSEINSLRVFSLLKYVSDILHHGRE